MTGTPESSIKSGFMEKPGIEPAIPGLDGIGPKIGKIAANCLSSVIADLIYKNINSGSFPSQLKSAKVFPIY